MIELLRGVEFELGGDIHVLGAAEHLVIDDVGDDGLIFAGKVFVQQLQRRSREISLLFVTDLDSETTEIQPPRHLLHHGSEPLRMHLNLLYRRPLRP